MYIRREVAVLVMGDAYLVPVEYLLLYLISGLEMLACWSWNSQLELIELRRINLTGVL
jgi:hypothetical protein